ncbi:MOSC domain-containing protein [Campylobacter fetus]|uniref:MOSC domain-containing protein n=1 Tax=Campylobacter fetus TaxID=196 RepID=UPI000508F7A4|nr:MOSC domain-containing protein [Campylobacter fetus]WKW17115.1 MOSC domain-containing protein [Campylobacter fetus subsp. fetus]AIR79375.1 hypothetical protein (MOSC domain) [Campylobacter fetus subsp. fetus 04/554]EAJ5693622.1 MOSC domain-containing protein [Campylobacter fetus]EAJ5703783.1 MOSC domain-containing protein [Campylobacter fetus]EAJ9256446.1 MOSC domain-containing protein [Campylobacter fetus]
MTLHSLYTGKIKTITGAGTYFETGMLKEPVCEEIYCDKLGFKGDEIKDTKHHGGLEKAVFANSLQNYVIWSKYLEKDMQKGFMGENLCIDGMHESNVCIGDIHKIGTLVLQVSQPRKPCFKLSGVWDNKSFTKYIFETGLTGWYYRVLETGSCKAGDEVIIVQADKVKMSVFELNMLFYSPKDNLNLVSKFEKVTTITSGWDIAIKQRLKGIYDSSYMSGI